MNNRYRYLLLLGLCLTTACARSSAYKQDQVYNREDSDYYHKASATSRAERFGQPKKRLFVLPFSNVTPLGGEELGLFASDEILREIRSAGRAVVPEDLKVTDTSSDFYSGDKIRLGALVRQGKRLGVGLLMVGKLKKVTYRTKGDEVGLFRSKRAVAAVDMEMRLFDINNAKELLFDEKSADSTSSQLNVFNSEDADPKSARDELVRMAIRNCMVLFATDTARALDKIGWEGRVAKISAGRVFINAGRATGLNIGDILKVLTPGEDVWDPNTNGYLGRSPGQSKGTLEIVDYLGHDGSVATVHSGGNFVENDIVQLY